MCCIHEVNMCIATIPVNNIEVESTTVTTIAETTTSKISTESTTTSATAVLTFKCEDGWIPVQRKSGGWCARFVLLDDLEFDCVSPTGEDLYSSIETVEELEIYLNEMRKTGVTYVVTDVYTDDDCWCDADESCPITTECKPPEIWLDSGRIPQELISRIELFYQDTNSFGYVLSITTENQLGLTDETAVFLTSPFLCGKPATSL
ncbi:unnamed protein product [Caenorhabditis angaria]|uniref:Uncharacterized protein n=1 Tax=Caenorhabditis angaria TaxID=860376 RepID=A0A9P1N7B1_9PELO|nr:unnamed protein product [Caenorhabditis angaria]